MLWIFINPSLTIADILKTVNEKLFSKNKFNYLESKKIDYNYD